jgi:hypothetical protein
MLIGCSSTLSINLNNQIWLGTATGQGNPDTFVRVTFRQAGKAITGTLELGQTVDTLEPLEPESELTGMLEGNSLDMATVSSDTVVLGTLGQDSKTFSGTLRFTEEGNDADFALTMTYQQDAALIQ